MLQMMCGTRHGASHAPAEWHANYLTNYPQQNFTRQHFAGKAPMQPLGAWKAAARTYTAARENGLTEYKA